MQKLTEVAPAFVEMAHRIVWCSAATVDAKGRPRSRVLHPIWDWDGKRLTGWVATGPTPMKRAHLAASAHVSANYWAPSQDTCVADCRAALVYDDATRDWLWDRFKNAPAPVGYDPAIIPGWKTPRDASFAALKLEPWRLRVQPASVMMGQGGKVLAWREG
jgi:hypothetical protein